MVIAFAAMLWLPNLFTKGMFLDGVYNALFGLNLANGIGSFWAPQTADYAQPNYWDNPQLSAYFLSLYYKALGSSYWVEKLYSLSTALIQLLLIASAWRIFFTNNAEVKKYSWLPCMLFMLMPLTSWSYSSNMMENTMSIFTTGSVIAFFIFLRTGKNIALYATIGSALIFLAMLTKGPVALFPLAVPFFFVWIEKDLSLQKAGTYMAVQLVVLAAIFATVFSFEAPNYFLHQYLDVQLLRSLKHEFGNSAPPYTIFVHMAVALSPLLGLSLVALFMKGEVAPRKQLLQTALVFIIIGLSASAPIALSAKQNKHYLIPSLPMFAVGFSCIILPLILWIERKLSGAKFLLAAQSLCLLIITGCVGLSIYNCGAYSRDEKLLRDLEAIAPLTKSEMIIPTNRNLYTDWALRANLYRHYGKKIAMPGETAPNGYYLAGMTRDELSATDTPIYQGNTYSLYSVAK